MPTYEYKCLDCGLTFEEFQFITAEPLRKCPECGKKNVKRLIGCGSGLIFKGSGFYQTDYRSENYQNAAKAEKAKKTDPSNKESSPAKKATASESKAEPSQSN